MKIANIGHASLVITAGEVTCFMDPVFVTPFAQGANTFKPEVTVDAAAAREQCQLIVLSHDHPDHFSPRSLSLLDRDCPVVFPKCAAGMERALARLGFSERWPLALGETLDVQGVRLTATASGAPFTEMGVLFEAEGATFWNLVDTLPTEGALSAIRASGRRVDLLFAPWQPLIDIPLMLNALGSGFPFAQYGELLRTVLDIRPRYVAPASCGFRFATGEWLNDRGFPMTERRFLEDVRKLDPEIRALEVPTAAAVTLGEEPRLEKNALDFVKLEPAGALAGYDWRPDRGVPPLRDTNPDGHPVQALRHEVAAFLDGELLARLGTLADRAWRERMVRLEARWRLEIVYPDGSHETRWLEYTPEGARWLEATEGLFPSIHTSVTASGLVGMLRGQLSCYRFFYNELRVAIRLYEPYRGGVQSAWRDGDEPLIRVLCPTADDRALEHELRLLGV
jgi:L-ascorbate metabolism protein UlaG (beta-lactamase superfamily)